MEAFEDESDLSENQFEDDEEEDVSDANEEEGFEEGSEDGDSEVEDESVDEEEDNESDDDDEEVESNEEDDSNDAEDSIEMKNKKNQLRSKADANVLKQQSLKTLKAPEEYDGEELVRSNGNQNGPFTLFVMPPPGMPADESFEQKIKEICPLVSNVDFKKAEQSRYILVGFKCMEDYLKGLQKLRQANIDGKKMLVDTRHMETDVEPSQFLGIRYIPSNASLDELASHFSGVDILKMLYSRTEENGLRAAITFKNIEDAIAAKQKPLTIAGTNAIVYFMKDKPVSLSSGKKRFRKRRRGGSRIPFGGGANMGGRELPRSRPQEMLPGYTQRGRGGPGNMQRGRGGPGNMQRGVGWPGNMQRGRGGPGNMQRGRGGPENRYPQRGGRGAKRPHWDGPERQQWWTNTGKPESMREHDDKNQGPPRGGETEQMPAVPSKKIKRDDAGLPVKQIKNDQEVRVNQKMKNKAESKKTELTSDSVSEQAPKKQKSTNAVSGKSLKSSSKIDANAAERKPSKSAVEKGEKLSKALRQVLSMENNGANKKLLNKKTPSKEHKVTSKKSGLAVGKAAGKKTKASRV